MRKKIKEGVLAIISHGPLAFDGKTYCAHTAKGQFIEELASYVKEVIVYTDIIGPQHEDYEFMSAYPLKSSDIKVYPLWHIKEKTEESWLTILLKYPREFIKLRTEIKKWDIAFYFMSNFAILAYLANKFSFSKKPFIIYFAGDIGQSLKFRKKFQHRLPRIIFALYSKFIGFIQRQMSKDSIYCLVHGKELYDVILPFKKETFPVVPMMRMNTFELNTREDTCASESLQLLFVGRLVRSKGLEYLITALRLVQGKGYDVKLNIVGSGEEADVLRRLANQLGIADYVKFRGFIAHGSKLWDIYRASDIFVLPTLTEGFPRVLYEAMGQGLPIISTNVGGISGILTNEENALIIPPRNSGAISESVIRLGADRKLRRKLIKKGLETLISSRERFEEFPNTASQVITLMQRYWI